MFENFFDTKKVFGENAVCLDERIQTKRLINKMEEVAKSEGFFVNNLTAEKDWYGSGPAELKINVSLFPLTFGKFTQNKIALVNVNPKKNTIVVKFDDGALGIAKCNGEKFDVEKGIAVAILKAKDKEKYTFIMDSLKGLDDKTIIKAEKSLVVYCAKGIVGKKQFSEIIKKEEK